ncbi:MAG: hypothetical protein ACFE0R_14745 [Salinarimonas sp.]
MAEDERAARLKAALRENLKRRKAQSRGRAPAADPHEGTAPSPAPETEPEPEQPSEN